MKPINEMAQKMRMTASRGRFDGTSRTAGYLTRCTRVHDESGAIVMFSRDEGHHACGWWKNPDYDKCWHLSLSFFDPKTGVRIGKNQALTQEWVDAFFREHQRLVWCEPPHSENGIKFDVWHYRLFYDKNGQPFMPRGEVYSKEYTPEGWKTWSEVNELLIHQQLPGEDPKVRRELERIRDELALKKEHLPKMYASLDEEIP